ncbi:oligosaccharide flippase family protein [Marinobacter sp. S6332]|uniref:oligosaccharide flippase family protein n=1 Tax=Marinobacter sp. S6332 TaxID=2926403 RepID=UPI001FF5BFCA|nr:oligosaccharide flippase family protein [Marinobacter sp. S6332]MCK0163986.1 oligosaccharide flippase family protein [Marinobacter sp. S6332]
MASIRGAVIFSFSARFAMRFLGLGTTMVVARLLTPEEIGTYAIASAIVMVMAEFRMLGASAYLIREPDIGAEKIRSTLGLTILISWALGLGILLGGFPVADFYQLPPISGIFAILSISFFIAPYISIPMTLLAREMSFKAQFRVLLISSVMGAFVTVSLVLAGWGFWSLAIGQLASPLTQFLIFCWRSPALMQFKPSFDGMRPIIGFGLLSSISLLVRKATVTVPDLIIGKVGTTGDVAMFSRGLGFLEFVSQTLVTGAQPVAFPFLTKTRREGGDLAKAYIQSSVMLGSVIVPVLGVASLASQPAIQLFFGDQWDAAAPIASILAIWAILRYSHWFARDALMAVGREGLMVIREIIPFAILVPLIIASYPGGLQAIAKSFVVVGIVDFILTCILLNYAIGLQVHRFFLAYWSNLLTLGTCTGATWLIDKQIPLDSIPAWQAIGLLALIIPLIWIGSLAMCKHPLYREIAKMIVDRLKG